jgi:hypothetical protein
MAPTSGTAGQVVADFGSDHGPTILAGTLKLISIASPTLRFSFRCASCIVVRANRRLETTVCGFRGTAPAARFRDTARIAPAFPVKVRS